MVVLRATKKVLRALPVCTGGSPQSDTALGDWYVNRLVVSRQPILLCVSSTSLLAMLLPARDVRSLPRLAELVAARLRRLGLADDLIEAEVAVMEPVYVAPTVSRSILGSMRDFMQLLPSYASKDGIRGDGLYIAEVKLSESPCRVTRSDAETIWPSQKARELLTRAWKVGPEPTHDAEIASVLGHERRSHAPFLERASSEGEHSALGLGAFFVLQFSDRVLAEPSNVYGMMSQIGEVNQYLDTRANVQEVWFLRAIVSSCEAFVRDSASPARVANALNSYAAWLASEERDAETAHVQLLVEEWNAV